jgi:trehalose/maltose transport system substrate-binding protein
MKHISAWNAANPHVQVELVTGPRSGTDRYGLFLQVFQSQSNEIDLFEIDVIWPGDLAEHLVDLNEYGGAEAVADDFAAIVANNTVDGRLVGLPLHTDGGLLYYRTDLLAKYGYTSPPVTWRELEEMALRIQEGERVAGNQDFWGFVWQGYAYEGLTCNALEWIFSSGGGAIVNPDKVITINNDAAANALDRAHDWIGVISPPGVTGFMEEDSRRVWQGGNAAFMRNWPYAFSLGNAQDSAIKGKFDIVTLPGAEAGMSAATLGGWQIGISKYSQHPLEAAEFAKWFSSAALQKERAISLSLLPTKRSLYDDAEIIAAQSVISRLLPVFMNAVARPSTATSPHYNEVSHIFFASVLSVLNGDSSGADAVLTIENELESLLGFVVGSP